MPLWAAARQVGIAVPYRYVWSAGFWMTCRRKPAMPTPQHTRAPGLAGLRSGPRHPRLRSKQPMVFDVPSVMLATVAIGSPSTALTRQMPPSPEGRAFQS